SDRSGFRRLTVHEIEIDWDKVAALRAKYQDISHPENGHNQSILHPEHNGHISIAERSPPMPPSDNQQVVDLLTRIVGLLEKQEPGLRRIEANTLAAGKSYQASVNAQRAGVTGKDEAASNFSCYISPTSGSFVEMITPKRSSVIEKK